MRRRLNRSRALPRPFKIPDVVDLKARADMRRALWRFRNRLALFLDFAMPCCGIEKTALRSLS
jgi:hypothetical protein